MCDTISNNLVCNFAFSFMILVPYLFSFQLPWQLLFIQWEKQLKIFLLPVARFFPATHGHYWQLDFFVLPTFTAKMNERKKLCLQLEKILLPVAGVFPFAIILWQNGWKIDLELSKIQQNKKIKNQGFTWESIKKNQGKSVDPCNHPTNSFCQPDITLNYNFPIKKSIKFNMKCRNKIIAIIIIIIMGYYGRQRYYDVIGGCVTIAKCCDEKSYLEISTKTQGQSISQGQRPPQIKF